MPTYRFTWDHFSDEIVDPLARAEGFDGQRGAPARTFLSQTVLRPDDDFVRRHRELLIDIWLREHPGARTIVDRLIDEGIGPGGSPKRPAEYLTY